MVPIVEVSTVEGLHVPVILLVEVVGKFGTVAPEQILSEVPKLNVGVVFGITVTEIATGIGTCFLPVKYGFRFCDVPGSADPEYFSFCRH